MGGKGSCELPLGQRSNQPTMTRPSQATWPFSPNVWPLGHRSKWGDLATLFARARDRVPELAELLPDECSGFATSVRHPELPRQRCDLCVGVPLPLARACPSKAHSAMEHGYAWTYR